MSEENVEMVRRSYEAFNRGDLEGMVADLGPRFEYVTTGAVPGTEHVYRGSEGFRRFVDALWGEFDDARVEVHELIEAGDKVLASITMRGRGKQSGVEVTWDIWQLWTAKDRKGVRGQAFTSKAEALEAAGLRE
jgi:ketosteroid isomerase-like protein